MERELASLKTDMEHVKKATEEIKIGVAEIITQIGNMSVDAESLRGRIREAEHDIISLKKDIDKITEETQREFKNLKSHIWKISAALATIAGAAGLGVEKFFGT